MADTYRLTPHETVTVREHTPDLLEVEGNWGAAGGSPPPPHLHPAQDEHFEVLEGELHAEVDGRSLTLGPGDALDIPSGTVHKMWNPGGAETRALWQTSPAGRTLDWWRSIDALNRDHPPGRLGVPSPPRLAARLREYDDVMRLAVGPPVVVDGVLRVLAALGGSRP
jgi:mannose-6-phosphate isomerase-like protein (cupin superfamily)